MGGISRGSTGCQGKGGGGEISLYALCIMRAAVRITFAPAPEQASHLDHAQDALLSDVIINAFWSENHLHPRLRQRSYHALQGRHGEVSTEGVFVPPE